MPDNVASNTLLTLTVDIVAAHVSNNQVPVSDLATLIGGVHTSLKGLSTTSPVAEIVQEPAVSIRTSIKPDYIVCLEDGKKLKMLKRHLMTHFQMTPADYRAKWNLPSDYPMVAPNYSAKRRALALKIGLGLKVAKPEAAPEPAPSKARRAPRKKLGVSTPS